MSEQQKQQIEVEEGNLSTAEADNDSDDYDFVGLDQTTPNNCNAGVLHQRQQRQNGIGTIWNPLGPAFSVDMNELKLKMAALEAKNELLEGRLEKMELKGKIRELQQEALGHKLKEAEAKAEMANNQLKSTIQAMQQEMANFELLAKEFRAKNNLKNHLPIHIGSKWPFECHLCEKTFIRVDTLQTHIRQMHLGNRLESKSSSETSTTKCKLLDENAMATIRASANLGGGGSVGCTPGHGVNSQSSSDHAENNSVFGSPNTIASEIKGEIRTFYCEWQNCPDEFPTEEAFVVHMNEVHLRAQQSPYFYCRWESCTRKEPFSHPYMLAQHVRKHSGEKPYICDYVSNDGIKCTNRYARLENLNTHQRTHIGDRPYKCRYCEKMFSNPSDCGKHQNRTHKSGKDYGCPVHRCDKQYMDPSSLRKHVFHEHGEGVWLLAKANKEAKKAKENNGLIRTHPDGTPFVLHSAAEVSSNDEDADGDVQVQMPTHDQIHFAINKAAVEEKLRKCQQSFVNVLTISKDQ